MSFAFHRRRPQHASLITLLAGFIFTNTPITKAQAPVELPTVTTIAGNHSAGYTGDNGPATSATFAANPTTASMDPAGNLYFADENNNVVRRVDAVTAIVTTIAGGGNSSVLCAAKQNTIGDGCPATQAILKLPVSARYHQGILYISDNGNARIRTVNLSTGIITTLAGGSATNKLSTTAVAANTVTIPSPQDIAFDNQGNLYFTTQGGKPSILKVILATSQIVIFADSAMSGGYTGDGGPAISATFVGEEGLLVDAQNNIFLADGNKVVRRIDGSTGIITTYAGGATTVCATATDTLGDGCPGAQAIFGSVIHLALDGSGGMLVVDAANNRIRRIAPGTSGVSGIVTTIAGSGVTPSSADGSYALNTAIGSPYDVETTPAGDIFVLDRSYTAVRVIRPSALFPATAVGTTSASANFFALTQSGPGNFIVAPPGEFALSTSSSCSAGVNLSGIVCSVPVTFTPALDGQRASALQYSDSSGSVLQGLVGVGLSPAVSLLPGMINTIAGTGTAGDSGDNGMATLAQLNAPAAVAIGSNGDTFVADTANNVVRKISAAGTVTLVAGSGVQGASGDGAAATSAQLNGPAGVAVDVAGNLYIADTGNNKIRIVDPVSGTISTLAGTGTAGYFGDAGGPAAATFNHPTGLFIAPAGVLFVADTGNNVLRTIGLHNGLVHTFAGNGSAGFSGDGAHAELAQLQAPTGVAVDPSGIVYIADTGNNRIRQVDSLGTITTLAGQTGGGFTGDGSAASTQLNAPAAIAVDASGTIYVVDTLNQRIRVIVHGQITTIAGTGTAGATGDSGTSTKATVSGPLGVAVDLSGNVIIADTANNKLRKITVASNTLTFANTNPNDTTAAQTVSVYDSGNQPLTITGITVPNGFVQQVGTGGADCTGFPLTLPVGNSCTVRIAFNPSSLGSFTGNVVISDNAQGVASVKQTIAISGTGAYTFTPVLTIPSTSVSGTAFTGTLTVINPQALYTGTMHFTSTDVKAVLPADTTYATADKSTRTFTFTLETAGPQCITVVDTTDSTITTTSCTMVAAGAPATITLSTGNNQSANVSTGYSSRLVVLVKDSVGNPIPNAKVTYTVIPNGAVTGTFGTASGLQGVDTESTDLSGFASSAALASGPTIGTFTVTANAVGTTSIVTFNFSIVILGSFTLTPTSASIGPIRPEQSFTQIINVTPVGGFSAPITMSCTAPSGITCSVAPSVVSFAAGKPVAQPQLSFQGEGSLRGGAIGSSLPGLVAVTLLSAAVLRRRRRFAAMLMASIVALMLCTSSGCGNGAFAPVTANGTYTVTVTGTTQTVSASTSATFTIQN